MDIEKEARVNRLAPDLPIKISAETMARVADLRASGQMSPFACKNTSAIRRDLSDRDRDTALRPAFLRDIEKIMHMGAYNRLAGKTQVFSFRADDDLARRGLHVQLVGRVARDIGRGLGLNEDLIEAIALGHDIGHTPFGHVGERYLDTIFHERTGRYFRHNVQSVRVLDVLGGRNLTLQTLDGVICHNGEFEQQVFETSGLTSFDTFDRVVDSCWERGDEVISHMRPMTLEGCVVRVSDMIAYVGKDRQDAIRAGLASEETFDDGLGGAYNSWALSAFIADVVENSFGKDRIEMSEQGFAELRRAKRENATKIYTSSEVNGDFAGPIEDFFSGLYMHELEALKSGDTSSAIFVQHIEPICRHLAPYGNTYRWEDDLDLTVMDFISSMTDEYFMASCEALFPEAAEIFPRRTYFEGILP
ncbi:putative dGTPase [Atopobium sp. oral taxon 810 str. F0209]|nr:putative dGTPase [Atopobium sp. oral taxon 810 str. F0209]